MIAMALACEPELLIADEPTTALDVTIQAQILALLRDLKERLGMAILLITHDMGVVAGHTDRVCVMYAGQVVETSDVVPLFRETRHPYTRALLASIPRFRQGRDKALPAIPGLPPDLSRPPRGCRFAARCFRATEKCRAEEPPLTGPTSAHRYSCWHPLNEPRTLAVSEVDVSGTTGTDLAAPDARSPRTADGARTSATEHKPGTATANGDREGPLLDLRNLVKEYPVGSNAFPRRDAARVNAVSDVSFSIPAGTTFGLVGESGCGKTTVGKMIVALERPNSGSVTFGGADVAKLRGAELRRKRRDLQLVFQDSHSSLDPRMRVGSIIAEPLHAQHWGSRQARRERVFELLAEVGLPKNTVERYPHEFSGGQRQRIGLARALSLNPRLIVLDEPVSALDVSIRAQMLNLMTRLQASHGLTYLVVSHDLTVVRHLADRIGVMYLGKLVEIGSGSDIYERPAHPYTAGLIAAIPLPSPAMEHAKKELAITGELPSPVNPPSGCRFRTRCRFARERCAVEEPRPRSFGPGHLAACHFPLRTATPPETTADFAG
jgi:oligopeptide/dipeptide ABC transporter ATP-binding protein